MTAEEIKQQLGLTPHPREGGWFIQTWASNEILAPSSFATGRYPGARRTATAIYYLLEPDTFSEMHRLRSDEVFHHYAGDPVEMLQLVPTGEGRRVILGRDLAAGQRPQVVVERNIWQGSRLVPGGQFALLGCTVSPGFEYEDYDSGSRAELLTVWPKWADLITALTHPE